MAAIPATAQPNLAAAIKSAHRRFNVETGFRKLASDMETVSGQAGWLLWGTSNGFLLSKGCSVNFQGPKGAKGDQGSTGITGQKGETGDMGVAGPPVRPSCCRCTPAAWSFRVPVSARADGTAAFAELSNGLPTPRYCGAGGHGSVESSLLLLLLLTAYSGGDLSSSEEEKNLCSK